MPDRPQRARAHPSHSQISLESYLLLPIQRIPRYRLLLETLLYVLRPALPSPPSDASSSFDDANLARRALIAYKRRTDGDDGFFELARRAGLEVRRVWEWGEVSVWAFE